MATKPTKRILDWASGGSTTDPGAGKEATGWVVSDRPPANWWNWILQSFGDWLSWSETSIDDIEDKTDYITVTQAVNLDTMESGIADNASDIAALDNRKVFGRLTTDGAGGYSLFGNGGIASADVTTLQQVTITYSSAFADENYVVLITPWNVAYPHYYHANGTTTLLSVVVRDLAGTILDPETNQIGFYFEIRESP